MKHVLALVLTMGLAAPVSAEGFSQVSEKGTFVSLVEGRQLTRFGIELDVTRDGRIQGRAFGRDVTGAWRWQAGYFCRDLFWGQMDLGPNCQAVKIQGRTIRFISDRGAGRYADLKLR
jgi:hypothetical protein